MLARCTVRAEPWILSSVNSCFSHFSYIFLCTELEISYVYLSLYSTNESAGEYINEKKSWAEDSFGLHCNSIQMWRS